jgi:hypothetical protein
MRLALVPPAILLAFAAMTSAMATDALPASAAKPFQLTRTARATAPGLHIRVVDPSGALAYPVPVAIEYDSGAPVRAEATAEGVTVPVDAERNVRAVTLGGSAPQRFDIDASRANFLVFSR